MEYTFDPHFQGDSRNCIAVVGCGGTGAQAARNIGRILYHMRQSGMQQVPKLLLIDPDTVEKKNIGRQLFTTAEIGMNKAIAVMRRLNYALNINCRAIPHPVDEDILKRARIVVGCVDNHHARKIIADTTHDCQPTSQWSTKAPIAWIDAGNHRNSGQVIIGNANKDELIKHDEHGKYPYLPSPAYLFPSLLQPDPEQNTDGLSCAELLALGEQDLLINDWMGIVAAQYVKQLLLMEPITTFITWIIPEFMMTKATAISPENLANTIQKE